MKSPIGSGFTGGTGAASGTATDGAKAGAGADVMIRLVEPGSVPDVVWLTFGLLVEIPTSRRANANAAHITGAPTGSPVCPADDCAPGPNPNHDNTPATTVANGGAAGVGGESATAGADNFAIVDTDGDADDGSASVEVLEETAARVDACAASDFGLPGDVLLLSRTLESATPAGALTLEAAPS